MAEICLIAPFLVPRLTVSVTSPSALMASLQLVELLLTKCDDRCRHLAEVEGSCLVILLGFYISYDCVTTHCHIANNVGHKSDMKPYLWQQ